MCCQFSSVYNVWRLPLHEVLCLAVCVEGVESPTPKSVLTGHQAEVTCLGIIAELGMVVSGSKGTVQLPMLAAKPGMLNTTCVIMYTCTYVCVHMHVCMGRVKMSTSIKRVSCIDMQKSQYSICMQICRHSSSLLVCVCVCVRTYIECCMLF